MRHRESAGDTVAVSCHGTRSPMPQIMTVHGHRELWARIRPLAEPDDAEWINVAHDLDTWPGARTAARLRMRRDAGGLARKLYSPAVLADAHDREILRDMVAHGMRVRITATALPRGTIIIDRRAIVLTGPAADTRTYTISAVPALIDAAYSLFEAAWEQATELSAFDLDRPRLDTQAHAVLRTLNSGATDETAARELGMSLRTYRRRVADLLLTLDAGSRFQAGVRAGELGLNRSRPQGG